MILVTMHYAFTYYVFHNGTCQCFTKNDQAIDSVLSVSYVVVVVVYAWLCESLTDAGGHR